MDLLAVIAFGFLAVLHVLPAMAAASPARITALYGIEPGDQVLMTLLQHRAVLLGLVGMACIAACLDPAVRWLSLLLAVTSMVGFIAIARLRGTDGGALRKIVVADLIGLPFVALAAATLIWR
jgi:hypothetical protein